jgi:hypothetical protein
MTAAVLLAPVRGVYANGANVIEIELAAATVTGETYAIDIAPYGGKKVLGVLGFRHSTIDSVIVQEQPTTAVSGTTLTITVGGTTAAGKRFYRVFIK